MIKVKDKNNIEWQEPTLVEVFKGSKKIGYKLDDKYKDYALEKFTLNLKDGSYETLAKPDIKEDKLLTDEESKQVKLALWNCGLVDEVNKKFKEGRKLIFKELLPAKNDYKHDYDRGTVHYTPLNRNYSYSKVIIPDGTTIRESNFTQRVPHTDAIQGENLTFIDCNLCNVQKHPGWILEGCINMQLKRKLISQVDEDGKKKLILSYQFEQDPINKPGEFTEQYQKENIVELDILENVLRKYEGM